MKKLEEGYSLNVILNRIEWLCLAFVLYGIVAGFLLAKKSYFVLFIAVLMMLFVIYHLAKGWAITSRKHVLGLGGELKVESQLSQLPNSFRHRNDLILGSVNANIDHVVVGTTGVWLIETKNWKKSSIVNYGDKLRRTIKGLGFRAWTLRNRLAEQGAKIDRVQPVLVFSLDKPPKDLVDKNVLIVSLQDLLPLIKSGAGRQALPAETCRKIYAILDKDAKEHA